MKFLKVFCWLGAGERQRQRQTETQTSVCRSTYLWIHWLILVCVLTWDQTCSLCISSQCSNPLSSRDTVSSLIALTFPHFVTKIIWSFNLLNKLTTLMGFLILDRFCINGINSTWLWWIVLPVGSWIWFASV